MQMQLEARRQKSNEGIQGNNGLSVVTVLFGMNTKQADFMQDKKKYQEKERSIGRSQTIY